MLNLWTCSLHPVYTAFKKGLDELGFQYESFFNDIHFYFKLLEGQREDYASLANITNVATEFAKKFGAARWLCMKHVGVRCLERLEKQK